MSRNFFLLDNKEMGLKFGIHLENTELGTVGIVNFHFLVNGEFEILLTDSHGINYYAKMQENPFSFSLPKEFVVDQDLKIDIFEAGEVVASRPTSTKTEKNTESERKNQKTDADIFEEAEYYIEKAKELFGEKKTSESRIEPLFFDSIKEDFELLYSIGEEDFSLSKKFKNSCWRKVDIGGEVYLLGKIFSSNLDTGVGRPNFVAIALPTTAENARANSPLGSFAKFYNSNIYDSFGFLVLVENSKTGKVVNL